ncbi:MAG: hypothetical protein KatS3mg010_1320 [Acidimicrobiia bacterium]|nr:MAG: hypothetical protein KatS3mg010_1320 [Acidimicrobiia bacterium]
MQSPDASANVGEGLLEPGGRPRSSLADALAAGGGGVVAIGTLLVAVDVIGDSEDPPWEAGALVFLVLLAIGYVVAFVGPLAARPAAVTVVAVSVPFVYGFLLLPEADAFADVRPFLLLTIATWLVAFAVPRTRGRPIFVAAAAILAWLWAIGEVADLDAYGAAPVPSPPYTTPGEVLDAARGGTDPQIVPAGFGGPSVTLDDLDPSDPLFPLAVQCDAGDDAACDELYQESPIGSDFEEFGATCGGRQPGDFGACAAPTGDFFENDSDDFFEDDFGDDDLFGDETPVPLPDSSAPEFLGADDDKAFEIGMVSAIFGIAYLVATHVLDARNRSRLATAFVLPAAAALITAVSSLGDASGSAVVGGLLAMGAGVGFGVVGFRSDRRFTAWLGGAGASVGALIIAGDISTSGDELAEGVDLMGPGLVVVAFGVGVVGLALLARQVLEDRPGPSPPDSETVPSV